MKNKYFLTAVCMYLNYIVIGVSVIILSMNMDALMEQFGTDRTGFGLVVSGIGIGKFIVLFISGVLSDKFGRKPFILIGMVGFIVYFMGILLSPNVPIALFFAVLAGMCNSFIDAGTYPALMEIFPTSAGTANLLYCDWLYCFEYCLYVYSWLSCIVYPIWCSRKRSQTNFL